MYKRQGYPWVGYDVKTNSDHYPYIAKSSKKDGTWATETGFPVQLSTVSNADYYNVHPCPLTGGKLYVVYINWDGKAFGKLWDGSSFGSEEQCSQYNTELGLCKSRSYGDDVYIVYERKGTGDIYLRKRTYGTGWGSEVFVAHRTGSPYGRLTFTIVDGTVYIFVCSDDRTKISLYTYDGDSVSGESDLFSGEENVRWLYSFFNKMERYAGVHWISGSSSPYNKRFGALAFPSTALKSSSHGGI